MPTRIALIITCPGTGRDFLEGVTEDLIAIKRYLCSPRGGSFYHSEIEHIDNPTASELKDVMENYNAEYQMVFFSGHGHTDRSSGRRMISLKDKHVRDWNLFSQSRIQTIIVDACRDIRQGMAGITEYIEPFAQFDGESEARRLFDEYITHASSGRILVHGTQIGAVAWELPDGHGGLFTQSLLHIATTMRTPKTYSPVYIQTMLPKVESHMLKQGRKGQTPEIVDMTPKFNMPFMIDAPQILAAPRKMQSSVSTKVRNVSPPQAVQQSSDLISSLLQFAGIGLFAIGIASLFGDSDK